MMNRIALPLAFGLVCASGPLVAQRPIAYRPPVELLSRPFRLGTERGVRNVFPINLTRPGRIQVTAKWNGGSIPLAVIVNRPGQEGYVARKDGTGPITLEFDVTAEQLQAGRNWRVSIVNFSQRGPVSGEVTVVRPGVRVTMENAGPPVRAVTDTPPTPTPPPAPSQDPVRTIGADGRIETRYPDGSIKRQGIEECGAEVELPGGQIQRFLCIEVQGVDLPALPQGLVGDEQMESWLSGLGGNLLETIRVMVGHDGAIDNYLNHEGDLPLIDKIKLRLKLIRKLSLG